MNVVIPNVLSFLDFE